MVGSFNTRSVLFKENNLVLHSWKEALELINAPTLWRRTAKVLNIEGILHLFVPIGLLNVWVRVEIFGNHVEELVRSVSPGYLRPIFMSSLGIFSPQRSLSQTLRVMQYTPILQSSTWLQLQDQRFEKWKLFMPGLASVHRNLIFTSTSIGKLPRCWAHRSISTKVYKMLTFQDNATSSWHCVGKALLCMHCKSGVRDN